MKNISTHHYIEGNKKSREWWRKIRIRVFLVVLIFFTVIGLCISLRPKKSVLEKRTLTAFPKFTFSALWDGSFFTDLQTWFADTYPLREKMIASEASMENIYGIRSTAIYGNSVQTAEKIPDADSTSAAPTPAPTMDSSESIKTSSSSSVSSSSVISDSEADEDLPDGTLHSAPEVAGTIMIVNNRGFETYYFAQSNADAYASMMNTVRSKLSSSVNIYDIIAPNSFGVCLDESVQESVGASNQDDAIKYVYSRLDPSIKAVSIFDTLKKHNSEYIYFNTDHHWTALGAYYAYKEFCKSKAVTPHKLTDFQKLSFSGFLGSFYAYSNQSPALAANPDTVDAYVPMGTNSEVFTNPDGNNIEWPIIMDVTDYAADAKYNCFIGGDEPYTEINNPAITDGSSCLILKESYGNAFVPYLVDHYQHVYVVDYRYYTGNLTQFVSDHSVSDVIFMNNTEAVTEDRAQMLNALFP